MSQKEINKSKEYRVSVIRRLIVNTPKSLLILLLRFKRFINPELTYYPEETHKTSLMIFLDQIRFILNYGFINTEYYTYGLDVKDGGVQSDFVPERLNIDNLLYQNRNFISKESKSFEYYNHLCLLRDKWIFSKMMEGWGFPVPKTIGAFIEKRFVRNGSYEFVDVSDFCMNDSDVLLKPISGNSGKGIIHVVVKNGELLVKDQTITPASLCELLTDKVYIVQEFIKNQHPDMKALFSGAINTLRVTMVRTNKGIELLGVMCLMGAHYAEYSNWHYGGVCINVKRNGCLDKYGFSFSDKRIIKHPDSGIVFENYKIPFYDEVISLAKKATNMFYGLKTIGWDIAITEDGPVFIEGNDGWGIQAHQMVENRGWKQQYEASFK